MQSRQPKNTGKPELRLDESGDGIDSVQKSRNDTLCANDKQKISDNRVTLSNERFDNMHIEGKVKQLNPKTTKIEDEEEDVYKPEESKPSTFADVFSDNELDDSR